MKNIDGKPVVEIGDILVCGGYIQKVEGIYSQAFWGHYDPEYPNYDWGIFLEAKTDKNRYVYWKQYYDCNGNGYISGNGLCYSKKGFEKI